MKFVLAPDSFKESMTATQAVAAMRRGVRSVFPDAECVAAPMADGGEGTLDTLTSALGGDIVPVAVHDALGRPILASWGWVDTERLAIIEVAAAAGLDQIAPVDRDPRITTSFGVGELIARALDRGATRFIVGLGGSACNDGGAGMLQALGAKLLDDSGAELPPGGAALARLRSIDVSGFDPRLADTAFQIACDVTNPLLGATGASAVFGPQKGADPATVQQLDAALTVYAGVIGELTGTDIAKRPGAGAAGGLGAAFLAFFPTEMRRGVSIVTDAVGLAALINGADYVFTGEGSLDSQTLNGKTPLGVAEAAAVHGVPVIAFAGRIGPGAEVLHDHGFSALVPISEDSPDLLSALRDGAVNLERAVAATCRSLADTRDDGDRGRA